jgi:tRNA threonylcarbamoyladenosine biosynthesis protein TsaE
MSAYPSPSASAPSARAELFSASEGETRRLGERLGSLCAPGDLILLEGGLGAGKTALAQGIGRGLGVAGAINSPTFTLVKEYRGHIPLYHFDLYRLDDPEQALDLGIDDYLEGEGVCVVEWAERAAALWPDDHLRIGFVIAGPTERQLHVEGHGPRASALCRALARASASRDEHRRADEEAG